MNALTRFPAQVAQVLPAIGLPAHDMPRALPIMDHVPEGCFAFSIKDDRTAPHLQLRDLAVIDPNDHAPRAVELYLINWSNGQFIVEPYKSSYSQSATPDQFLWFVRQVNNPRTWEETLRWLKEGRCVATADGPYDFDQLEAKLLGRVIGIIPREEAPPRPVANDWRINLEATSYFKIEDESALPYMHPGEFATVDTEHRMLTQDALYLIEAPFDGRSIVKVWKRSHQWFAAAPNYLACRLRTLGPMSEQQLSDLVVGRVFGVMTNLF